MNQTTTDANHWAGIDTHSDFHVIALTDAHGHLVETRRTTTDPEAINEAVTWLTGLAPLAIGIEGTSSYGASIAVALQAAGHTIMEVTAANKVVRRQRGKSDELDALQAAEAVRIGQRVSPVKDLSILPPLRAAYTLRTSALRQRTQVGNELHAIARSLQIPLKGMLTRVKAAALLQYPQIALAAARWLHLDDEARHYYKVLLGWLQTHAPELLAHSGIGPVSATQLVLAAGGNPDRLTHETGLAALSGVAPIPISSGKTQDRHRLCRGGDRAANQALWRIAFHRYHDKTNLSTQLYKAKRTTLGDTPKRILRLIQRALVRELFPDLKTITDRLATP